MFPVRLARTSLLSLVVTAPAFAQVEQRTIRGADVAIYNLAGVVRAVPGTGPGVTVDITRRGSGANQLRIESGPLGGRETLRIVYPSDRIVYRDGRDGMRTSVSVREDGTFSDGNWSSRDRDRDRVEIRASGSGLEAHADLTVRVPRGQKIALFLAAGRAEVSNVEGDILVDVGAAEVEVSGTKGNLALDTGSGHVTVRDVTGNVDLDSGSGGLTIDRVKGDVLTIDSGSGGVRGSDIEVRELSVEAGSGGLRFAGVKATRVTAESGSGGVDLAFASDVESLDVETGSGGATIRLPATLSAEIEAETGSGGFSTDFEIVTRRVSRNHVLGRIGAGKGRVRLEAGSGSIRLFKLAQ
jgi:lia operon protein LiaG